VIEGVVLRYGFRNDGGDPPTTVEIPIIRDRVTGRSWNWIRAVI